MQGVIIAAGESTRFWPFNNGVHKSQFQLLGKSLLYWTLKGFVQNNISDVAVVVNKHSSIPEMLDKENDLGLQLTYLVQQEPKGTGNALASAKEFIKEPFVLFWGNKVGSRELIGGMLAKQREGADAVFVGRRVDDPTGYGVFRLQGEKVLEMVEKPESGQAPSDVAISGARLLGPDFFSYYDSLATYHEVDLIDATNAYIKEKNASLLLADGPGLTLKYPWDVFGVMDFLFASDYFSPSVAKSAKIARNVVMKGPIYIGENVEIKEGSIVEGPAYIGDNCKIGYHNVLRGPISVEAKVKTGAFMELKHAAVQEGSVFHSGYVGDSVIGKQCRFGANLVTGNLRLDKQPIYGLSKLGVVIGDHSVFGIHAGTMPGVMVGSNCKVGPGTHVFDHLADSATYYAKFQEVKK